MVIVHSFPIKNGDFPKFSTYSTETYRDHWFLQDFRKNRPPKIRHRPLTAESTESLSWKGIIPQSLWKNINKSRTDPEDIGRPCSGAFFSSFSAVSSKDQQTPICLPLRVVQIGSNVLQQKKNNPRARGLVSSSGDPPGTRRSELLHQVGHNSYIPT